MATTPRLITCFVCHESVRAVVYSAHRRACFPGGTHVCHRCGYRLHVYSMDAIADHTLAQCDRYLADPNYGPSRDQMTQVRLAARLGITITRKEG